MNLPQCLVRIQAHHPLNTIRCQPFHENNILLGKAKRRFVWHKGHNKSHLFRWLLIYMFPNISSFCLGGV